MTTKEMDRRAFLNKSAALVAGGATLGSSAASYARIMGANERISLGHIGIGSRGKELDKIAALLHKDYNAEMTGVCDLWSVNRGAARAANAEHYGRAPRTYGTPEDILGQKDIDAIFISTPEHSHSPLLKLVAEAGKTCTSKSRWEMFWPKRKLHATLSLSEADCASRHTAPQRAVP